VTSRTDRQIRQLAALFELQVAGRTDSASCVD
jgi:hypothetical protein